MVQIKKTIYSTVAVLLVLALFFGFGYFIGSRQKDAVPVNNDDDGFDLKLPTEVEKRIVTKEEVSAKLIEISELSTYSGEYTVSKAADFTRYVLDDIPIPGTTNSITLTCTGVVKVGYDVNDISPTVDNESQKIYISLPAASVNDNYIIWDSVQCSEKNSIFNPIDFEQYKTLIAEIEDLGLQQVTKDGIFKAAEENIKMIICNFLSGFEEYEVVFL